ncbi:hypothetical protein [Spirosoma spitsbergense]|uniref:hypothetical protein n=1 Tax=Spirosoma spitsbergense TaxID=431554 RepID=UPI0012FB4AF4|nr:hypothetical protein [Spirosoma spitsbergense]
MIPHHHPIPTHHSLLIIAVLLLCYQLKPATYQGKGTVGGLLAGPPVRCGGGCSGGAGQAADRPIIKTPGSRLAGCFLY